MFQKSDLAAPARTGENRLPARTLLLPAQKRGVTHKNFTESDRVQLLSGEWKFSYRPEDTDEAFYLPAADDGAWDALPVPSMWQFYGYGSCLYPNVRYPFPYDPPYIHRENPVGLYRRRFTAKKNGRRAILRFLGVENLFCVWLNGQYVGFSKGSRIPAEFDVTALLSDGENLLAVKVYTFSDASYLENQDMLAANGIFRDVTLLYTGENALWDYTVLPDEKGFTVRYRCTVGQTPAALRFTLYDADENRLAAAECALAEAGEVRLPLQNAKKWNAEQPYLYTLYIETAEDGEITEVHTKKVGIAKSEIVGSSLLMNGSPITLKGVNRHENNARTGRAITAAQIEAELRDIKTHNLNAIRCSHYTNQPLFYELCSELGIYVMDEADCESHGAECVGDQGALNKDDSWFPAFFDRISRMYAINKNETCVNIWSLGNECGTGQNADKCRAWLREQEIKKPIKTDEAPTPGEGEFCLTGYMPMQTLMESSPEKGPLMMVEYAHAMGNSPGGLEDIWNWVYENEHCCGGYVWEFKSHGFYTAGKNGRPRYLYGGDFRDDRYHWSNFSLDGYHTSDGTPKPAWGELKEVSAPVHVRWEANGVRVKNTYDFLPLDGAVLNWRVCENGAPVRQGTLPLDGLAARQWRFFPLPLETWGLRGLVTADCVFYQNGKQLAHKQKILLHEAAAPEKSQSFPHGVSQNAHSVAVTGDDFAVTIENGLLSKIEKDGRVLLDSPLQLNCRRAPTDNDGAIFPPNHGEEWKEKLVHTMRFGCYHVSVCDAPEEVTVKAEGKFLPHSHYWGFHAAFCYQITAGGRVQISIDLHPYGDKPAILPRIGTALSLPADYSRCRWLGRGPGESYPDCKANAPVGVYEADVKEMRFAYDVPQETGSHEDCARVTVFGANGALTAEGKFAFSFHDVSLDDLSAARHCDELEPSERRTLYLDHRMRGLGSHSCGPEPEAEYELPTGDFSWNFWLTPQ